MAYKHIRLLNINVCSSRQMEAQANTTREESNKKNIYDAGWQPSHGENGGVGKKIIVSTLWTSPQWSNLNTFLYITKMYLLI